MSKEPIREVFMHSAVKKNKSRVTVAGIINYDNKTVSVAKSQCSTNDVYVKDRGRNIAIGRALKHGKVIKFKKPEDAMKLFKIEALNLIPKNIRRQPPVKKAEAV